MPRGTKWCKNEGVNCSEGVKRGKSWAAKGVKCCESARLIIQRG